MWLLWHLPDGQTIHNSEQLEDTCLTSEQKRLLLCSSNGEIGLSGLPSEWKMLEFTSLVEWKKLSSDIQKIWEGFANISEELAISNDGQTIVSSKLDNTVQVYVLEDPIKSLCNISIEDRLRSDNLNLLQILLKKSVLPQYERSWAELVLALVHWRMRFDIQVDDAPELIHSGEFDIEIEA